jgi:universal stress protein E
VNAFSSILVDVDATAQSQPALERAVVLARNCGARLRIVDVASARFDAHGSLSAELEDELVAQRREKLARLAYGLRGVDAETDVLAGTPADALVRQVERFGHDLLVRSHARDIASRAHCPFGPIDLQLFRRCRCTVWALGAGMPPQYPRVLAAVDMAGDPVRTALARRVIETAVVLARLQAGSLMLLHVWQPVAERRVAGAASADEFGAFLDSVRRRTKQDFVTLAKSFGRPLLGARLELRRGLVESILPEFVVAEGIDLVVMGTLGRTGIARRIRPNLVESMLDRLPCSVVAVRSTEPVCSVRMGRRGLEGAVG